MNAKRALATVLSALALSGCMSEEEAANQDFQQVLEEMGLDETNTRRQAGLIDGAKDLLGGAKGWLENLTLCQVLRRAMGDDPANQSWIFASGWHAEGNIWHFGVGGGAETAYDLANYQIGRFATVFGQAFKTTMGGAKLRGGWYRGLYWGHHTSVLDVAGPRAGALVSWFPPFLRFIADITIKGLVLPGDNPLFGGHLGLEVGPQIDVEDVASGGVTQVFPKIRLEGGYAWPITEGVPVLAGGAADVARRDADLGAKLNTRCGEDMPFVQYEGKPEDADKGYHARRSKALAEAIRRSTAILGLKIDPAGWLLSKAVLGLGVARDHGGFAAVCGGDDNGGLNESPVPEPRCPERPDFNPEEPEPEPSASTVSPHEPTPVAKCHRYAKFDLRFCSSECLCKEGEGDCDSDDECEPGLTCLKNAGADYAGPANVDVCVRGTGATSTQPDPGPDPVTDPVEGASQVMFVSPQDGDRVEPEVAVELSVGSDIEVDRLVLLVDNNFEKEWTAPPFTTTVVLEPGMHTMKAVLKDVAGNVTESRAISVTVDTGEGSAGGAVQPEGGTSQNPAGTQPWTPEGMMPSDSGCSLSGSQPDIALCSLVLLLLGLVARRRRR